MCYSERKDQDFGFQQLYVDSQRKGDGGSEETWAAMDKDPFFVSKNLYCVLHGCNAKTTPLGDIWRLFGKWDYDCADFAGPCFIYNGDPETTPATMAEQIHRSIPQVLARKVDEIKKLTKSNFQSKLLIMTGHGHTTIMMEAANIIQALISGKIATQIFPSQIN